MQQQQQQQQQQQRVASGRSACTRSGWSHRPAARTGDPGMHSHPSGTHVDMCPGPPRPPRLEPRRRSHCHTGTGRRPVTPVAGEGVALEAEGAGATANAVRVIETVASRRGTRLAALAIRTTRIVPNRLSLFAWQPLGSARQAVFCARWAGYRQCHQGQRHRHHQYRVKVPTMDYVFPLRRKSSLSTATYSCTTTTGSSTGTGTTEHC